MGPEQRTFRPNLCKSRSSPISPSLPSAAVLTGYGGFGSSFTPQFTAFAAFFIEQGGLFALANIRGGGERGEEWHLAAKPRNRQHTRNLQSGKSNRCSTRPIRGNCRRRIEF